MNSFQMQSVCKQKYKQNKLPLLELIKKYKRAEMHYVI